MTLHVRLHVPSKYISSAWYHSMYMSPPCVCSLHVPSVCISLCVSPPVLCPLRVVLLPYVCFFAWLFLYVYFASIYMSLRMYVPTFAYSFRVYVLPCGCPSMCMSPLSVCPSVCTLLHEILLELVLLKQQASAAGK